MTKLHLLLFFFLTFSVRQTSTFQMLHHIISNRFVEEIDVNFGSSKSVKDFCQPLSYKLFGENFKFFQHEFTGMRKVLCSTLVHAGRNKIFFPSTLFLVTLIVKSFFLKLETRLQSSPCEVTCTYLTSPVPWH